MAVLHQYQDAIAIVVVAIIFIIIIIYYHNHLLLIIIIYNHYELLEIFLLFVIYFRNKQQSGCDSAQLSNQWNTACLALLREHVFHLLFFHIFIFVIIILRTELYYQHKWANKANFTSSETSSETWTCLASWQLWEPSLNPSLATFVEECCRLWWSSFSCMCS